MKLLLSLFLSMTIFAHVLVAADYSTELTHLDDVEHPNSIIMEKISLEQDKSLSAKVGESAWYAVAGLCNVANSIGSGALLTTGLMTHNPFCIVGGVITASGSCFTAILLAGIVHDCTC